MGPASSRANVEPALQVTTTAAGQAAAAANSTDAVSYRIGESGDLVPGIGTWTLDADPGLYQVTFKILATPDTSPDTTSGMVCGAHPNRGREQGALACSYAVAATGMENCIADGDGIDSERREKMEKLFLALV